MFEEENRLYQRMSDVIKHLYENAEKQPSLSELAHVACMSESHFQRTFEAWVGVSPKQFLQASSRAQAKSLLNADMSISVASEQVGYSSASRLYDNFIRFESITPGDFKRKGAGLLVSFGVSNSPFGKALIAWTSRGIIKLSFLHSELDLNAAVAELCYEWPNAVCTKDDVGAQSFAAQIFNHSTDAQVRSSRAPLKLFVKGTVFQVRVWEALLAIPEGQTWSYQSLAASAAKASSVRAVASAVAKNPIAYIIPCHRVIRASGAINQYRWGVERKTALLLSELGRGASE